MPERYSGDICRIALTAVKGAILFGALLEGTLTVWLWLYLSPRVPLGLLIASNRGLLLGFVGAGLVSGAVVGLPRRWYYGLALYAGIGVAILFLGLALYVLLVPADFAWTVIALAFGIGGLLRASTQLPRRITASRRVARCLAEMVATGALVGIALLLSRVVLVFDEYLVLEIQSAFDYAQVEGWQIQSLDLGGLEAESGYGVQINLGDGSTHHCVYWIGLGDALEYHPEHPYDPRELISCARPTLTP